MKISNIGGKVKRYILLLLCLIALVFSGCGAGGGSAPPGSTITINPSSISFTGIIAEITQNLTVTVTDSEGNPLSNAEIWISGSYAAPRSPTHYQFCRRSDGVDPVNSSFSAETDSFGTYNFSIIIPATVDGEANVVTDKIEIRSGDAYATATVTVTAGS